VSCGQLALRGIATHGDVAEESKRMRLVSSSWMCTRECEELVGECARVLDAANK
jgi:hypothetical protein